MRMTTANSKQPFSFCSVHEPMGTTTMLTRIMHGWRHKTNYINTSTCQDEKLLHFQRLWYQLQRTSCLRCIASILCHVDFFRRNITESRRQNNIHRRNVGESCFPLSWSLENPLVPSLCHVIRLSFIKSLIKVVIQEPPSSWPLPLILFPRRRCLLVSRGCRQHLRPACNRPRQRRAANNSKMNN